MWGAAAAAAKSLQSCPTLCDPRDGGPPGSPIPGILQARTLEWVAISFSNAWKWKVKVKSLSCVWLLVTPWAAAYQAPPPMGFSRQEYWSGVPLPSLCEDLGKTNSWGRADTFWGDNICISTCFARSKHQDWVILLEIILKEVSYRKLATCHNYSFSITNFCKPATGKFFVSQYPLWWGKRIFV